MKKFKIGIIGAGAIVESSHLPVLKTLSSVEVEWVYDISEKRRSLLSEMYGIKAIQTIELEVAIKDVDICLLTIPYGARSEYIKSIAAAGKALYVEKPFALTVSEHEEYCRWFEPYKLAIGFQRRQYNLVQKLSTVISSEVLGKLKRIEFTQGYFNLKGGKGYLSDARLSGGGVIIESAIHSLDQLLLITGAQEVSLEQINSLHKSGIDYDSVFSSTLTMHDRRLAVDCRISTLRNLDNGIRIHFDNGILESTTEVDPFLRIKQSRDSDTHIRLDTAFYRNGRQYAATVTESFKLFWKRFLGAIEQKQPNETSGINSLLTTKWMEQVYNRINR